MAGYDNIKDKGFDTRSTEELRAIQRKGGKRSGEARRRKADMKATLETLLSLPLNNGNNVDPESVQSIAEMNGQNIDVNTAILLAQIQKALKGSVMSAQFIRDTAGQQPETLLALQNGETDTGLNINVSYGKPKDEKKEGEQ